MRPHTWVMVDGTRRGEGGGGINSSPSVPCSPYALVSLSSCPASHRISVTQCCHFFFYFFHFPPTCGFRFLPSLLPLSLEFTFTSSASTNVSSSRHWDHLQEGLSAKTRAPEQATINF